MRAAAVGAVGYSAGKAHQARNQQEADASAQAQQEQEQAAQAQQPQYQAAPQAAPPQQSAGAGDEDRYAKLAQLGQLHDSGVLTDAEFEQEKQRLLGG